MPASLVPPLPSLCPNLYTYLLLPGLTVSLCLSLPASPPHLCPAATSQPEDPVHVLCEYCACSSCVPVNPVSLCSSVLPEPVCSLYLS